MFSGKTKIITQIIFKYYSNNDNDDNKNTDKG